MGGGLCRLVEVASSELASLGQPCMHSLTWACQGCELNTWVTSAFGHSLDLVTFDLS